MTDLDRYLTTVRDAPFEWGRWDCCLFCLSWLHKKGVTDWRPPPYKTIREAMKVYRDVSVVSLAETWLEPVMFALPGAIVAKTSSGFAEKAYGITDGDHAYFVDHAGLVRLELNTKDKYWHTDALFPKPV